jgi:hypothetical protein
MISNMAPRKRKMLSKKKSIDKSNLITSAFEQLDQHDVNI